MKERVTLACMITIVMETDWESPFDFSLFSANDGSSKFSLVTCMQGAGLESLPILGDPGNTLKNS